MAEAAGAKAIKRRTTTKSSHNSLGSAVGDDTKSIKKYPARRSLVDCKDLGYLSVSETNLTGNDERFTSSMRLSRSLDGVTSRHPLHVAISKGSEIDVQMILDELGPNAVASIQWSDCEGRTALHIAALSKNKKITAVLLNFFRSWESRQLSIDFVALEEEFHETTANVQQQSIDYLYAYWFKQLENIMEEKLLNLNSDIDATVQSSLLTTVKDKYRTEKARRLRQFEFRNEVWWLGNLFSKDSEGRTPLHYAVGCGASADLLEALVRTGHGHFNVKCNSNRKYTIKETDILFNSTSIYDLESGREVAKCTKGSKLQPSSSADPKILSKQVFQEVGHARLGDIAVNLDNRLTREKNVPSVDCDVIIPWVLRNMLGSIGDQNIEYEACRNDVRRLKSTLLEYDNSGLGILLVPELEYFLDSLEIRVTKDVLREMCRRYPGDMMDIRDKFIWIESKLQREGSRRALMMDAEESSGDRKSGEKMYTGSDDSYRRADSEGNYPMTRTSSSPSYHSDSKSSSKATESSLEHKRVSESKQSARGPLPCKYTSMVFDKIDENLGLNILQLLNDISSGRGLEYVTSTYNDNSSVEGTTTSQGMNLRDGLYSTGGNVYCPKGDGYHSVSCCVTVAAIMKGRRDVVNICDSLGRTPLLIASALGYKKVVACLLAMGGDISIVAHDGQSAFSVAKSSDAQAIPQKTILSWMNQRGSIFKDESHMRNSKIITSVLGTGEEQDAKSGINELLQKGKLNDIDDARSGSGGRVMNVEERAVAMAGVCSSLQSLKGAKWSYSRPPLMWAVHSGLLSAVEDLLCGTPSHDPNTCDTMGRSSLHECVALIRSGRTDLAEAAVPIALALMESGAMVNHASIGGRTPLHDLFCVNQDEKVSSHRVSAEDTTNPFGDLCAVIRSKRTILMSLLEHGADPELLDRQGLGAIHYCAREDSDDCLLEILMSTTDEWPLTRLQQSPLHIACKAGAIKTAKLLCKWDADHIPSGHRKLSILLQADGQGKLPIQLLPHNISSRCLETLWGAARAGYLSSVTHILHQIKCIEDESLHTNSWRTHRGNDTNLVQDRRSGSQPQSSTESWLDDTVNSKTRRLKWNACHACVIGWAEYLYTTQQVAERKPRKGPWNQAKRPPGRLKEKQPTTPRLSSSACVALGLTSQDVPSGLDARNKCLRQHKQVLALLMQSHVFVDGLDVNCRTPLLLSAAFNLCEAITLLLDHGAEIRSSDLEGNTALHLAYAFGSMTCVLYLEFRGADSNAKNLKGRAPLEEAGSCALIQPLFSATNTIS